MKLLANRTKEVNLAYEVRTPSRYAPATAIGFATAGDKLQIASNEQPLPVRLTEAGSPAPLAGSASGAGSAGPFIPAIGRPMTLALDGEWNGKIRVLRSTDGGETLHPLTAAGERWASFAGNVCEVVWEEHDRDATFYLDIAISSGTAHYRLAH